MTSPTLSVIVAVYNEATFLEESLRRLRAVSLPSIVSTQIIVVDDGSTDGTPQILTRLQSSLGLELLREERNRGKGAALRRGIERATGTFTVFHDADLEYDPTDFRQMLEPLVLGKADAVYGSRFVGSEMRRVLFFWHEVGNRLLTTLVNMLTNLNFTDVETCYKMFRTDLLTSVPLVSDRFGIEPEITIKGARRGFRFYEVPIAYNGRTYEQGKKIDWRDGVSAVFHILRFGLFDRS